LRSGAVLDRKTKMLYDERSVFVNGESWRCAGADAKTLRQLADQRRLSAAHIERASESVKALLHDWLEAGWLHESDGI
jgi:50S ribosomal protein L16 3-hydroxylase